MWVKFLEPLYRWLTAYMGSVGFILYGGGKGGGSSAPPPDPNLINANIRAIDIQNQAIQKMMSQSDAMAPLQNEQIRFGLDSARSAYDQSQEDRTWMLGRRGILADTQDKMAKDAADFNTEGRANELAGQATADVNAAFSNAQAQNGRAMARMGINPGSGKAQALGNQTAIAQAAAMAGASTNARTAARNEGRALTDRVANSVAGYPAMGMQATGAGAGYGASGITIANTGLGGLNSGVAQAGNMAGSMGANAASMYGAMGSYKNGQDQLNQGESFGSIVGGLGGLAAGAAKIAPLFSDRRLKENITLVGKDENTGLNLYEFSYISDPAHIRFRGVMADEVQAFKPDAVIYNKQGFASVDYGMLGIEMIEV